jgi:hypothetical protein
LLGEGSIKLNNKLLPYFVITIIKRFEMKKVICLLMVVLTSSICLGQTKKNSLKEKSFKESDVIFKCDSLSKVYKLNVVSYKSVVRDGIQKYFIGYVEGTELKEKQIPKPVR